MKNLDAIQINNLIAGNTLAAEIPMEREYYKFFVVVWGHYRNPDIKVSRILNDPGKKELLFSVLKCEIEEKYIDSWDADYYIQNEIRTEDIRGIEELETILLEYLDDLSKLGTNVNHPY